MEKVKSREKGEDDETKLKDLDNKIFFFFTSIAPVMDKISRQGQGMKYRKGSKKLKKRIFPSLPTLPF